MQHYPQNRLVEAASAGQQTPQALAPHYFAISGGQHSETFLL